MADRQKQKQHAQQGRNEQLLEQEILDRLESGKMESEDDRSRALDALSPRYEVRIRAEKDPIAEETESVEQYVQEENPRYLAYRKKD